LWCVLEDVTSPAMTNKNRNRWTVLVCKGKVIPVQTVEALTVVRGSGTHIFRHSAHRWQQGCQPYTLAAFYPQENFWYSFLLEAESTPGTWWGWKD
jgi:hypothetical protein